MADDVRTEKDLTRGRGRPRAKVSCTAVSTWMPDPYTDKLIQIASQHGMSVSGLVRQIVILRLRDL